MQLAPFAAGIDASGQFCKVGNQVAHHAAGGKNGGHRITRGWDGPTSVGLSWADRVFDPAVKARYTEVDRLLAKDLALQLLLAQTLHQTDQALNLDPDILVEILLGNDGRLRVGDGIDPDEVVIAPARMDLLRAAFTFNDPLDG